MKYFAKLDENNIVLTVVPVHADVADTEANGIKFLKKIFKHDSWKECSKDHSMRKNPAKIGGTYDAGRDAFIPAKPFPSWTLNDSTCDWDPPVAVPESDTPHRWDEESGDWVQVSS
jgi:hypothetical protein